ncbi:MAG: hypothetical protein WEB29_09050 [Chloroflexota bacterium]
MSDGWSSGAHREKHDGFLTPRRHPLDIAGATPSWTYENLRDIVVENERTVDETLSILATTASADRQDHQQEYDTPWDTGRP